jgi:hypothetical protein
MDERRKREIIRRAREMLARVDRTLALEKLPERGRYREHERRRHGRDGLIFKVKWDARLP